MSFTIIEGSVVLYDANGNPVAVANAQEVADASGALVAGSDGVHVRFLRTATDGTIRVDPTGTTAQPISGTVTANVGTTNGLSLDSTLTGGTQRSKITDGTSDAAVKAASTSAGASDPALVVGLSPNSPLPAGSNALGSVTVTGTPSVSISGTPTVSLSGTPSVSISGTSTVSGTVTVQQGTAANLNATVVGTVTVQQDTAANLLSEVSQPTASDLNATVVQGSAASLPGKWPVQVTDGTNVLPTGDDVSRAIYQKITDGTNGPVSVKPDSISASVSDPSLVVGLSPNSPLPAGSNALGSVTVTGTPSVSGTVTANIGTTNGLALDSTLTGGTQRTKITDGTTNVSVKAASTAASATDTALVVGLSPNSPLPAGSNALGSVSQGAGAAATVPWSVEFSDGTTFYVGAKTGQFPASLVGGRLDSNVGAWLGSTAPSVGQKTSSSSIPVVLASNQSVLGVQTEVQADFDTGAGTQNLSLLGIALPGSGGAVVGGTSTNPFNISGTVAQGSPASTANSWGVKITDGTNGPAAIETSGADSASNTNNALSTKARLVGYNGTTWDRLRASLTSPSSTFTGFLNQLPWAVFNTTPTTRTNGQGGPLQATAGGALVTAITDGSSTDTASIELSGADSASNTNNALTVSSRLVGYNGTTWDRIRASLTSPSSTFTGFLNQLPWAIFNTTPTTRTNGQGGPLQADSNGYLLVSQGSWSRFQNLGANATLNVKSSSGRVLSVYMRNLNAAVRYLQLFNTATVPTTGDTPYYTFLIPASGYTVIDGTFFGPNGANFPTGIAFAFSTTEKTYTAGAASDHITQIQYV